MKLVFHLFSLFNDVLVCLFFKNIYDSGLCTTGVISQLAGDVLSTDTSIVVDKLKSIHALPNLTGITVKWTGLCCVAGNQEKIPDSYRYKLQSLWDAIIKASSGTVVFDSTPVTGEELNGLPHVSSVSFPEDSLDINLTNSSVISFHEDTVKFTSDTANFIDTKAVNKALVPVAEYLMSNSSEKILIVGTTAKIGNDDGV